MNKNFIRTCIVAAAVFVIFAALAFALPFKMNATFWICFVFEFIVVVFQVVIFKTAFIGDSALKSKIYGFPIFRVGYIYFTFQTIANFILMTIGTTVSRMPWYISFCTGLILLLLAIIGCIATNSSREVIENIETKETVNLSSMRNMQSIAKSLINFTSDSSLKNKLSNLDEDFRFSDPVSSSNTQNIEAELETMLSDLETKLNNNEAKEEDITAIQNKLKIRNSLCKSEK